VLSGVEGRLGAQVEGIPRFAAGGADL